ncbi:hypothetical protein [Desulfosporosinus sp. SB140]|uniref:hypothetical protein n=1 Tax=Desulfosporosinus paludis TaxID=3115649 RepID=UPI00388EEC8A
MSLLVLNPLKKKHRIKVYDGFNRANNAASLGNADTGQLWSALSGIWGITGNTAYVSTSSGGRDVSVIDSGSCNGIAKIVLPIVASFTNPRLILRASDVQNYLMVSTASSNTAYSLFRVVANVATQIGTYTTTPVNGDEVKTILNGTSIQVFINGLLRISVTESFNQTATKFGIGTAANDPTSRFDNFYMGV